MRRRRVHAGFPRRWAWGLTPKLVFGAGFVAAAASGCAAEVTTLEPTGEPQAGVGGMQLLAAGTAGQAGTGGAGVSPSAGAPGSAGTKGGNAFGGTASTAGSPATGGAGGMAGGSSAGAGGTAGKANGGSTGGGAGGGGGTASGGSAGTSGTGGGAGGGNLACLASWKNDACDTCSKQTQSDKLGCVDILDCYAANACGPATCGSNDAKCGANKIGKGTAGYPIAADVYNCLCK